MAASAPSFSERPFPTDAAAQRRLLAGGAIPARAVALDTAAPYFPSAASTALSSLVAARFQSIHSDSSDPGTDLGLELVSVDG